MTGRDGCIGLNLVSGIGFIRFNNLVEYFEGADQVFGHDADEYARVKGIGSQTAAKLAAFDFQREIDGELELASRTGVRIVSYYDSAYPEVLRQLYDPPLCLYIRGKLPEFPDKAVAIVGSRRLSAYGERMTRSLAADAAACGFTVVSGLAIGVDTAAHRTVVESGGNTVAVLGSGLLHLHPRENSGLARDIVESGGAVISEFPMNLPPSRTNFPRRNRIVAGLCRGTIVTEAGIESGALITAQQALENNRDVFAVPGHADNPQAKGCHKLIKDGAALVENFDDVLSAFGMAFIPDAPVNATPEDMPIYSDLDENSRKICQILDEGETGLEELQMALNIDTGPLLALLMKLEMQLLIERTPEQIYRRIR